MFTVSYIGTYGELATPPGGHIFWRIKFVLAIFVEGHLITNSAKSFFILTNGFRRRCLKFLT